MRTRSSLNLVGESSSNPTTSKSKRRNRRRSKQPFSLEKSPLHTMADQRTMAELLRAPTKGYAKAIVVPPILAEHFDLKHSLINMMTSDQFFRLKTDNPHDHIRWFNKITSIIKYKDVPNSAIKIMLFPFSLVGAARRWLKKEPPRSILTWEDLAWDLYKDLLRACPHHGFTELHQLDTFYNALNPADQYSLNSAADGNLLERRTQDVLTIIENKSKIAKLTHAVNQQTSTVTTAMTAILKQFQATPHPDYVKAIEEICVTCGGAHPCYQCLAADHNTFLEFHDNIQGYVSAAAVNYNQGPLPSNTIAYPKEEDEHVEETLTDLKLAEYTIKVPHPFVQKAKPPLLRNYVMLKALLSNKKKLLELANTPLNENCSAIILKMLPMKLGDPGKFLIPCGFSELKCKALADLANRAICKPTGIARDVFVSVGKFTFLADFVFVDYESDPRVPLILGRPFLRTTHDLIDVHGEEMILYEGDERLTLNTRHDTSNYLNQPQKESINMIDMYNDSYEDYLEDLFVTNNLSGNPTFSSHTDLTSPEVINPLSGNTTYSSPDHLLKEFIDELALITFPPRNDDLLLDIESDLREIEYLLNHDPTKEMDSILEDSVDEGNLTDLNNDLVDTIPEMFTDEHTIDYSSPPLYDDVDDDLAELESNNDDVYDDPFDSKKDNIKESKLFIDELDPPRSSDSFLPLITIRVTPDKNAKKISISNASLILEDFNPPLYELPFHK
nr:reverse transcriptase domain-containing protein [Tanacetum cinerariifolium]